MKLVPLPLNGAYLVQPQPVNDARGHFTRYFDQEVFARHGLVHQFAQAATSLSHTRGTVRGLHYQRAPHAEVKLVRCARGSMYDVIVDLRQDSPTYLQHHAQRLSAEMPALIYVPAGFAHGYMTLTENCEVEYHISVPYRGDHQDGVRWNDPKLGIVWPEAMTVINARDAAFALL